MVSKSKNTSKPKKKKKVEKKVVEELYNEYDLQHMFNDLNKLKKLCEKLGHTNIILNIILTKGRLSGVYDPLQAIQKAKIVEDDKTVNVQIVEYKNDVV